MTTMAEHVRAPRRRGDLIRDSRLRQADMRTRIGKRFTAILAGIRSEFGPDVDPVRSAELARLKMIGESVQAACLAGNVSVDRVVRISNLIQRAERQLASVSKGKPSSPVADLHAYLHQTYGSDQAEDEPSDHDVDGGAS
jgi:hypothetical protein